MNSKSLIRLTHALIAIACFLGFAQVAAAAAGKVLFVAGSVTRERNGSALKAGDALELGDVIVTGAQSRAQILMADGARIALRAGSSFRIDELALPASVRTPAMSAAVATSGRSVGTLLKGGFSTRDGAVGKNNPSGYEMRTPVGTLGIRGTQYTAVLCRGDCADAPGLLPGQPIPDGLYLAVDEGTITFNGRGLSLTLTAPRFEFIPLETGDPQQLTVPPTFLRNDGAGALELAGSRVRIAASNTAFADVNERRSPSDTGAQGEATEKPASDVPPERTILATSLLGRPLDLTDGQVPPPARASVATAVPASGVAAFTANNTASSDALAFDATGNLVQFDAPYGTGAGAVPATYLSGTAGLVDAGSDGASAIRWGRWSTGTATANTPNGAQTLTLANASLHWIVGPSFELTPVLPVTGNANFVLAGGTSPTSSIGQLGALNAAVLAADFTAQQVTTSLSLDLGGYNWIASGSGPITSGSVLFDGTFNNVLVDGRIAGAGSFSGFFSAGPSTPDQVNGVGLGYQLTENLNQLGTVSGVLALVPGTGQLPPPPTVVRDVAYSTGGLDSELLATGAANDLATQVSVDANGDLTAFFAPLPRSTSGTLQIGTTSVANTGADAATGLRWGRWQGGNVNVVVAPNPANPRDFTSQSLHWIAGTGYGSPPVLPQAGTASYVLVGNTDPTDTLANIGTLGAASLSADFTNRTVASALSLNVGGFNWYASGNGTFGAGSTLFNGTYDTVSVENLIAGSGSFSGFFTAPRLGGGTAPGAALTYSMASATPQLGAINGVLAFQQGQGNPLPPPPLQQRDIAVLVPNVGMPSDLVYTAAPAAYAVDADFNLTRLVGVAANPDPVELGSFGIGTSAIVEADVNPFIMLRWGRWSGGDAVVTNLTTNQTGTFSLAQQSIHWVESADALNPPAIPQAGIVTYQLAGWTTPTDRIGNLGTLNAASFAADFTNQLVTTTLDVTINNLNWLANGTGVIGAQAGLPAHQFSGVIAGGIISPIQGTPTGTFSGFFSAPGSSTPGVPGGVGLSYTMEDGQGLFIVDGVVVFRAP